MGPVRCTIPPMDAALGSPFIAFAVQAAREAVEDAQLQLTPELSPRVAVVLGSANGGDGARELAWERRAAGVRPHPQTVLRVMTNAAVGAISMQLSITGPALTISTACASGAHAIGQAFRMVQHGEADVALAGGSEELPGLTTTKAWEQMRVLSRSICRPFARERDGLTLAEGAGVLVLETLSGALERGAPIYAEIAGFTMGADACDWLNADCSGLVRCMQGALADAGLGAAELGYINAHATGTVRGDAVEAEALRELLGGTPVPVSSTKALHGHAIGASGALEAIASILAVKESWLPGMPVTDAEEGLGLRFVWQAGDEPEYADVAAVLSNSFAFGGLNASLVFRRASDWTAQR